MTSDWYSAAFNATESESVCKTALILPDGSISCSNA